MIPRTAKKGGGQEPQLPCSRVLTGVMVAERELRGPGRAGVQGP